MSCGWRVGTTTRDEERFGHNKVCHRHHTAVNSMNMYGDSPSHTDEVNGKNKNISQQRKRDD